MGILCRVNVALIYRGQKKVRERRLESESSDRRTFTCGVFFFRFSLGAPTGLLVSLRQH